MKTNTGSIITLSIIASMTHLGASHGLDIEKLVQEESSNIQPYSVASTSIYGFDFGYTYPIGKDEFVNIDISEFMKNKEIESIKNTIEKIHHVKIHATWSPNHDEDKNLCLFIKLVEQDAKLEEDEDLDIKIYASVENILFNNRYYKMVSLF